MTRLLSTAYASWLKFREAERTFEICGGDSWACEDLVNGLVEEFGEEVMTDAWTGHAYR